MKLAVLAGGEGRRIGGDKPLKVLQGKPLIFWVLKTLLNLGKPVIISVKTKEQKKSLESTLRLLGVSLKDVVFVLDEIPELMGPISGIYSLLKNSSQGEVLIITAADQPFVSEKAISTLMEISDYFNHSKVVVTKGENKTHPFPGVYPTYILNLLENFLKKSPKKSLFRFFSLLKEKNCVYFLKESELGKENFVNINTEEDLKAVSHVFTAAGKP